MSEKKVALITGITGQDGSYLAELLLSKGYEVHGTVRRSSSLNTGRIDHVFNPESKAYIHFADLADGSVIDIIYQIKPDEIYNLGAMSHVRVSFDIPVYTADITGVGVVRLLEGIRRGIKFGILKKDTKYYQASSSEMFGQTPTPETGYTEQSVFTPVSPYGCAKLFGYHMTRTYRNGYGIFASNGILFNHESPRRGETFVTKKITRAASRIALGVQKELVLGNLDALRDWGHSKDYMEAIWMILQHDKADDFLVATGEFFTVRDFLDKVFAYFNLDWKNHVRTLDDYKRPNEVPSLLGDSTKIRTVLGWKPKYNIDSLVKEMCDNDYAEEKAKLREIKYNREKDDGVNHE